MQIKFLNATREAEWIAAQDCCSPKPPVRLVELVEFFIELNGSVSVVVSDEVSDSYVNPYELFEFAEEGTYSFSSVEEFEDFVELLNKEALYELCEREQEA